MLLSSQVSSQKPTYSIIKGPQKEHLISFCNFCFSCRQMDPTPVHLRNLENSLPDASWTRAPGV